MRFEWDEVKNRRNLEKHKVRKRQAKEIEALKRLRDEEIDLTDIRPLKNWNKAVIGKFLAPQRRA